MTAFYVWLKTQLHDLRHNEKGVTIVEYVIMLALVAIAVALAAPNVREAIVGVFDQVIDAISTAGGGTPA